MHRRLQLIRNSPASAVARIRAVTRAPLQASSFHSYHQPNPLAKNHSAYQLQSLIAYLQLFTVISAKISSRSLHNPTYSILPIILLSKSPLTHGHYSSQV